MSVSSTAECPSVCTQAGDEGAGRRRIARHLHGLGSGGGRGAASGNGRSVSGQRTTTVCLVGRQRARRVNGICSAGGGGCPSSLASHHQRVGEGEQGGETTYPRGESVPVGGQLSAPGVGGANGDQRRMA